MYGGDSDLAKARAKLNECSTQLCFCYAVLFKISTKYASPPNADVERAGMYFSEACRCRNLAEEARTLANAGGAPNGH